MFGRCAMILSMCRRPKWRHDSTWSNLKAEDIQYVAVHPGRLLHARIPRGQSSVDLVNWYQYSVSDAEGVFDRRLTLLTKLQKCIAGLPQRNSLLLAGDFNCPVMAHPPVSGSCVLQCPLDPLPGRKGSSKCASYSAPLCLERLAEAPARTTGHIHVR